MNAPTNPMSQQEPWDLVAEGYAEQASIVMEPFARLALKAAAPCPDAHVLDVAAGSGALALAAAPLVASVCAVDFSERMLEQLAVRAAAQGLSNVEASVADGQALPFDEARFDAAFSMFGLMFFPDRSRGFSELLRVLKPGGRAVVSSWAPIETSPLMLVMFEAIRHIDPDLFVPPANMLSLENPEVFEREMEDTGFVDVSVTAQKVEVTVTNVDGFWNGMTQSSAPLALMRKRLGEDAWQSGAARARAFLERRFSSGPQSLSTTAYLGVGRKP